MFGAMPRLYLFGILVEFMLWNTVLAFPTCIPYDISTVFVQAFCSYLGQFKATLFVYQNTSLQGFVFAALIVPILEALSDMLKLRTISDLLNNLNVLKF
jgi:hypothetical protein